MSISFDIIKYFYKKIKKNMANKKEISKKTYDIDKIFKWYQIDWDRISLKKINVKKFWWDLPDLLYLQKEWYRSFVEWYLNQLFDSISPIDDNAWVWLSVVVWDINVMESQYTSEECKRKELTYWWIITGKIKLVDTNTKKVLFNKRANIWILPLMTSSATYIVNWVERAIISQMVRSYWIFYSYNDFKYWFKLIPERWPWLEISIEKSKVMIARISKSRKFPITTLLRVFWAETDESIRSIFSNVVDEDDINYIDYTLAKDTTTDKMSAAKFIYNKLRPWELIDEESALDYIKNQFMSHDRMCLWKIARRKINAKLWLEKDISDPNSSLFDWDDLVASIRYLLWMANQKKWFYIDDPDHLSNKRVRLMWEILYNHLQPIMRKFVKSIKWKLSILDLENPIKITSLVNFKMIDNSIKSFFATSQLSQFLDQINPLSEIEHKRRITLLWPWWLKRETAKFEVRDVHPSQYWRICPIETPEWPNIWLVIYQALYSKINWEGFLETPALKVYKDVLVSVKELENKIAHRDIYELDSKWNKTKKIIIKEWEYITKDIAKKIEKFYWKFSTKIKVKPYVNWDIEYISPEIDEKYYVTDATTPLDNYWNILATRVAWRHYTEMEMFHVNDITHMDVNPAQIFSVNTSLIPFVNHNDAVRASMWTNQQRQSLALLKNDAPLVWTWLEKEILRWSHFVIRAEDDWEVIYVDWKRVKAKYKSWIKEYKLINFSRSNHKTCIHQVARVSLWQKIKKWDILAEWPCVENWEIALWKNLRVAFMPWKWYNYEDAIVISDRLVREDALTSIKIEQYKIEVSDTKLWPEQTTNDIPWISMSKLKNLNEDWIIRIWSVVKWWDILVWKITPKSEWDLTPEEKLIQAIFWDKSKSVKDTSLYMSAWTEWKVIDVVVLDAKKWDNVMAWVRKKIKVYVASTRKIEIWDKLTWKHWNKWIVSIVVPEEDMPYSEDWKPVDVVLNTLWVISRMNLWQVFEVQLWLIAKTLWVKFSVDHFSWVSSEDISKLAKIAWLPEDMKMKLYDWKTWQAYDQRVTVWYMHILKLVHMVEDKIHARSVWPYSLITQQPLWWKSRHWWQRFWEMEVWSLEAYSAVYTLQEMLTVKSDDVVWRNKMYNAIIKWQKLDLWWLPESFNFLIYLFKWLVQNIQPLTKEEINKIHADRAKKILDLWLSWAIVDSSSDIIEIDGEKSNIINSEKQEKQEKQEMMSNVIKEMEDFWEIEDDE